jgi:hypothetical protein
MKLRIALVFALVASLSPALALARTQTPSVHSHGATFHDRSPHLRLHEPQPHH